MDVWTEVGTVSAVVAAVAGIGAIGVSWYYGQRATEGAEQALRYERIREARELVGRIEITAGNTRWHETSEAGARLRAVLMTLPGEFTACQKLAETEWNLDSYTSEDLHGTVGRARAELEAAVTSTL